MDTSIQWNHLRKVLILIILGFGSHGASGSEAADGEDEIRPGGPLLKDFTWPNRQLNVLVDIRSINETERQLLAAILDQIDHKTCIKINRLSPNRINPFDTTGKLPESERNFIYIFKAQFGLAHSDRPPLGLSTFGCINRGRQSMVLGDLAFKWPELVLKYHLLRSLGVANLTRPEAEVRRRLSELPMGQKIGTDDSGGKTGRRDSTDKFDLAPTFFAYATFAGLADRNKNFANKRRASVPSETDRRSTQVIPVEYLSEQDLKLVKDLYNCSDYQNRLSPKLLDDELGSEETPSSANLYSSMPSDGPPFSSDLTGALDPTNIPQNEATSMASGHGNSTPEPKINDAAKSIMGQLISEVQEDMRSSSTEEATAPSFSTLAPDSQCEPLESCPLNQGLDQGSEGRTLPTASLYSNNSLVDIGGGQHKPMLLKLDDFHAQDPHLQQADQMKLSQLNNNSIETYRLMNAADLTPSQPQFKLPPHTTPSDSKSEVLISFEQSQNPIGGQQTGDTASALASSQVLKLCSCTCQTMAPVPPNPQPATTTVSPTTSQQESSSVEPATTAKPTTTTTTRLPPTTDKPTEEPDDLTDWPPSRLPVDPSTTTTTRAPKTTTTKLPTTATTTERSLTTRQTITEWPVTNTSPHRHTHTESPTTKEETTTQWPSSTSPGTDDATDPLPTVSTTSNLADNPCDLVQWVKPNKTVYSSARIVWDVDRGNQNYFLCNRLVEGELIPGKTHGMSCKVGAAGHAYELQNFNVLTKPENVNLIWIQRASQNLGKTYLPVLGGYSKSQDPLVVSRCVVLDENNNPLTLIGYINNHGVGWFPFDDIQIECSKYDVLACVS